MNIADLDGKTFTLWLTNESNESAVFPGVARCNESALVIEGALNRPFVVRPEWYEQIQTVKNEEARYILKGAEYFLRLYIGNLAEEVAAHKAEQAGMMSS